MHSNSFISVFVLLIFMQCGKSKTKLAEADCKGIEILAHSDLDCFH